MAKNQYEELEDRKKKLRSELDNIQKEMDDNFDRVKTEVSSSLDPLGYVRRHPLPMVGIAALVGFFLGNDDDDLGGHHEDDSSEKISSTIWYELKRLAAKKALSKVGDYIDEIF